MEIKKFNKILHFYIFENIMHRVYFNRFPKEYFTDKHKCFVLTTKKIFKHCGFFLKKISDIKDCCKVIYVPDGEKYKNIEVALNVLEVLYKNKASKKDILICLGGGVITDLGGFCASIYKRGMRFIYIPTTLLGMVDAAIGGKNGINFQNTKNIIGTFSFPEAIYVSEEFLSTLSDSEYQNGLSEIFKISLVSDSSFYHMLCKGLYKKNILRTIKKAIELKKQITNKDPYEKNLRKILNFGHTFGHAIEAYYQGKSKTIPHGKAVATGMVLEVLLSFLKGWLSELTAHDIIYQLRRHLNLISDLPSTPDLMPYLIQDKKNKNNKILCVGLKQIGEPIIDLELTRGEVQASLDLYSLWIRK